jgi:hypothetical protein
MWRSFSITPSMKFNETEMLSAPALNSTYANVNVVSRDPLFFAAWNYQRCSFCW